GRVSELGGDLAQLPGGLGVERGAQQVRRGVVVEVEPVVVGPTVAQVAVGGGDGEVHEGLHRRVVLGQQGGVVVGLPQLPGHVDAGVGPTGVVGAAVEDAGDGGGDAGVGAAGQLRIPQVLQPL